MESSYKNFFSYPQDWVTPGTAFGSQFVAAAVMMIAVLSLGDDQNNPPGAGMHAFVRNKQFPPHFLLNMPLLDRGVVHSQL